jgi:hypothetical protein
MGADGAAEDQITSLDAAEPFVSFLNSSAPRE